MANDRRLSAVRIGLDAVQEEFRMLKIQIEHAASPQAIDYSALDAAIAAARELVSDDTTPAEAPRTTPLLRDSDETYVSATPPDTAY